MKNNKGITLIALVITVIVLIILAGASIAMLTGENSIIISSRNAKAKNNDAAAAEKINTELENIKTGLEVDGEIDAADWTALGLTGTIDSPNTMPTKDGIASSTSEIIIIVSKISEQDSTKKVQGKLTIAAKGEKFTLELASANKLE